MESRLTQLQKRVTSLRAESEEVWKTLETAETTLLEMLSAKDYDCSGYFGDSAQPLSKPPETVSIKARADRQETEEFYLTVSWNCVGKRVLKSTSFLEVSRVSPGILQDSPLRRKARISSSISSCWGSWVMPNYATGGKNTKTKANRSTAAQWTAKAIWRFTGRISGSH